jgi:hypothetical protein
VPYEAVSISDYIGKDLEGSRRGVNEVLSRYLPRGTEKSPNPSVSIAYVLAGNRIEHRLHSSLELYRYISLIGFLMLNMRKYSNHYALKG